MRLDKYWLHALADAELSTRALIGERFVIENIPFWMRRASIGPALFWILFLCLKCAGAATPTPSEHFFSLPLDEQRRYLHDAVLEYRRTFANIEVEVGSSIQLFKFDRATNQRGEILYEGARPHVGLRRIGPSYRVEYWVENRDGKSTPEPAITQEAYDAKEGVDRYLSILKRGENRNYAGIIQAERLAITQECFLYQYLGDMDDHLENLSPSAWVLSNLDKTIIKRSPDGDSVAEVSFPHPTETDSAVGTDKVRIDLNRGAMISSFEIDCSFPEDVGKRDYKFKLIVDDSTHVNDGWLPTKIHHEAWMSLKPNEITIGRYEVSNISVGKLSPKDLEVEFPPRTRVLDNIAGIRWLVGKNNEKLEVIPADLVGPQGQLTPAPARQTWVWLTACVTAILAVLVLIKRLGRRRLAPA